MLRTRPALFLGALASLALAATLAVPASGMAAPAPSGPKGKASLVGKVLDNKGKVVKTGYVEVWKRDSRLAADGGAPVAVVPLTTQGTYQVQGLAPKTAYYVMATSPGFMQTWAPGYGANHPRDLSPRRSEVKTLAGSRAKTVPTIRLLKGGYTLTGRIAGHKKADKVTVLACTDMMVTYLDVQDFSPANRGYCYRGFVARDGSYMVPGMASAVAAVTVSSARASRIAVVDMLAKAKNRVATQNFAALARTVAPAINVPTVSVSGYFAPGFTLTAGVTAPLPSGPPVTMSYVWTDGGTILDRGPTLAVTQAMMGAIVHPIVIASIADRDIAAFVPGRNNLAGEEASVDTIPFPGRIHGADGPLALVPSEKKQPWGRSYAAEDPPTGWTYDYQWMCNNSQIPGAITGAYDTVLANIGCTLTVVIDAHGPSGQGGTRRIVNPAIIVDSRDIDPAMMAVQGPGTIGATLQLVNPPAATFAPSYQWLRDTLPINGATGTSYVLTPADKGSIVTVSVIAKASGYRTLDAVIGRVLVAPVKPTITAKVSSKAVATKQQAKLPITVQILDDPWNGEVGLAGTLKVKVGKKSVSKTLKAADLGSVTLTLPKLPKGKHKVSITFTPTDKAISKGTLNPKGKVVVR